MEPRDLVQKTGNDTLVLSTVLFDWGAARGGPSRLLRSALHFEGAAVSPGDTLVFLLAGDATCSGAMQALLSAGAVLNGSQIC